MWSIIYHQLLMNYHMWSSLESYMNIWTIIYDHLWNHIWTTCCEQSYVNTHIWTYKLSYIITYELSYVSRVQVTIFGWSLLYTYELGIILLSLTYYEYSKTIYNKEKINNMSGYLICTKNLHSYIFLFPISLLHLHRCQTFWKSLTHRCRPRLHWLLPKMKIVTK